jgi:uncharacterized membrane protein
MMGYGYGYNGWNMMSGGFGIFGAMLCIVLVVDLILVGIWLWHNINKK